MKVAIHQPHYLPWLGYLAKWSAADLFIFLDVVQYEKNGWQNRSRIKTQHGPNWLTVPVHAHLGTRISDVTIDETQSWRARHLRAFEQAYARAPWIDAFHGGLRELYASAWTHLAPLAARSAEWLARAAGIAAPVMLASVLDVASEDATGRLVALCRAVGADTYLAGAEGAHYMDLGQFATAGIRVLAQSYTHPVYPQAHGDFVPQLSGLDLLLSVGDGALPIIESGNSWSRLV